MKYRIKTNYNERILIHILLFLLMLLIFLGFYFKPIFLQYKLHPDRSESDLRSYLDLVESQYASDNWHNKISGGFPLFQLKGIDKFLADLKNKLLPEDSLNLLFLLLGGLGIYSLFVFFRYPPGLALSAALMFSLSFYYFSGFLAGRFSVVRFIGLLPWIIFLSIYLKNRKSLLAGGLLSLVLILSFKNLVPGLIISVLLLNIVYWIVSVIHLLRNKTVGHALMFTLLFFLANVLALASISYPGYYLFTLQKHTASDLMITNYQEILFIYIHIAVIFFWCALMKRSVNLIDDLETIYFDRLRSFITILIVLLAAIFILRFYFDLSVIPKFSIYLQLMFLLHCILIIFFRKKTISSRIFYVVIILVTIFFLLICQLDNLTRIKPISVQASYKEITISDDYFSQDPGIFRIYPLGKEFPRNNWGIHNETIGGKFPYRLRRYNTIIESCLNAELQNRIPINWNVLDMLNVKYLTFKSKINADNLKYSFYDLEKKLIIYKNISYLPRAWFVNNAIVLGSEAEILKFINSSEFDPEFTAILETSVSQVTKPENAEVLLDTVSSDFLKISTSNDSTSLLVISEIYYPGNNSWKAYLDDSETPIYPVNYILRGVVIPAGKHELIMRYELNELPVLLLINMLSLVVTLMLILLGIYHYIRKNYKGELVYVINK
ncbi:hypothetical protein ACFLYK_02595 [Candidatus Cloacimonadota bacterium]